jgi:hypothetical protein
MMPEDELKELAAEAPRGSIKLRQPLKVGTLTVSQYVLRRDGVDVPQWLVISSDPKTSHRPILKP